MEAELHPVVLELAPRIAHRGALRYQHMHEYDDIVQHLLIEGWRATLRFDPAKSSNLRSFVGWRMSNAVIDYIRDSAPYSRDVWLSLSQAQQDLVLLPELDVEMVRDSGYEERGYAEVDARMVVVQAVAGMEPRGRYIAEQHWLLGRTNQDVAADLGVSPGRVSQLQREAFARARRALGGVAA